MGVRRVGWHTMDYHLKYNELMGKTDAIFAEDENILTRIHRMIGYSPFQTIGHKDELEMIVRETEKKFFVVCKFLRDFIERNYVSRVKPFRSYSGIIEAYDLTDRFMGNELGAITLEAIIAIGLPGERAPLRNLLRMIIYDNPVNEKTALEKLVIFINALEAAKKYREAKGECSSNDQPLSVFYSGTFVDIEISDMEKMDEMLSAIRAEDTFRWYLRRVIYPMMLQKFDSSIFEMDDIKSDSWKRIWDCLKNIPPLDTEIETDSPGKYVLENEDTIRMIIKDALTQYRSGTLYTYHPMWLFGSRLYWDVLHDYLIMFQQDFELFQMKQMMEVF